ncbi:MAG: GTPase [Desulfomonilaceae bacterium]
MAVLLGQPDLGLDPRVKNYPALKKQIIDTGGLLHAVEWRNRLGPGFPVLICILGGTGAGKSVLFNSLIAAKGSKVGLIRPCTRGAVISCPLSLVNTLEDFLNEWGFGSESQIFPYQARTFENVILVDTPDFDSIEKSNQIISNHFFVLSDLILFVASQEKYADMAGRKVIRNAFKWGKEISVILNKAVSEDAFADFQQSLCNEFPEMELSRIDRIEGIPDILPTDSRITHFLNVLEKFESIDEVFRLRNAEHTRLRSITLENLETTIDSINNFQARVRKVIHCVETAAEKVIEEVESQLDVSGSKDVEERIQVRLENLLRKYDILYAPRSAVRMAFRKVFTAIRSAIPANWVGRDEAGIDEKVSIETFLQNDYGYSLVMIEASIARFNLSVAEILSSDEDFSDFRSIALESCPRLTSEQIRTFYEQVFPNIEQLLEGEFEKFKQGLSTADELKLYGSYTLWAVFLVTAEVAIGGGITLLDMVLNTAIAPFIPKWLLKLKVVDILRDIAARVDSYRRDAFRKILQSQAKVYTDVFLTLGPNEASVRNLLNLRDSLQNTV